jgi:hypothetical protein
MKELVSIDFLFVPTVRFRFLNVLLVLSLEGRRMLHYAVMEHPTAAWIAQHVVEAYPWDTSPKYLLRDRDKVYGGWFRRRVKNMGIEEVLTAPHSTCQNPYSGRTCLSIWTTRTHVRFRQLTRAQSYWFLKSAGFTTGMNAALPEPRA